MRFSFVTLFAVASVGWISQGVGNREEAQITVFPEREIAPVNRLVLGGFVSGPKVYRYLDADWYHVFGSRGGGIWNPETRKAETEYADAAREAGIAIWRLSCDIEWTKVVGPLSKREKFRFGLPEFLAWCEETNAFPILICYVWNIYNWPYFPDGKRDKPEAMSSREFIASYNADLVEYLNAPNDGSNPNGGIDWAAVRAADGHPQPYNVTWFEFGNEEYGGADLKMKIWGFKGVAEMAREYGIRYLQSRRAMKAVDPSIKLGAVVQYDNPKSGLWKEWNSEVLKVAGKELDFAISHHYWPQFLGNTRSVAEAGAAVGKEVQERFDLLNKFVENETGRSDIPWAITEWSVAPFSKFAGAMPAALATAHHIGVMMQPRNRVALATYASFASPNLVSGYPFRGDRLTRYAPFYVFQFYKERFGDTLIEAQTACGGWKFAGEFFDWGGVSVSPGMVSNLSVNAGKKKDGTLTLIVINTNPDADINTTIVLAGGARPSAQGRAWSLVGSPEATHFGSKPPIQVIETQVRRNSKGWQVMLPRYSVTAIEIRP